MTNIIEFSGVTKDYGKGRGIFDVSFDIRPGMVYGFIEIGRASCRERVF